MAAMNQRGLSLIEALTALAILAMAAVAVIPAFMSQVAANTRSEHRFGAIAAAEQVLESFRLVAPRTLPDSGTEPARSIWISGREFTVVTTYCETPAYCGSDSRHLYVEVALDGRVIYDAETVYTTFE